MTRPELPQAEPQEQLQPVTATTVELATQQPWITLHAQVEAPRQSTLEAVVGADVLAVPAREGSAVTSGQTLVQLDPRELDLLLAQRQAEVAEIQAQIDLENQRHSSDQQLLLREQELLELALAEVTRAEELLSSRAGSRTLLDQAQEKYQRQALALHAREREVADHPSRLAQLEARFQRAQALLAQAQLDRQRATLSAPFAGRIVHVAVSPGDRVRPGDALITLYADDDLELRAQIPFRHLPAIRDGMHHGSLSAQATLDGQALPLQLQRLAAATRHGGAEGLFSVASPALGLLPGRLLEVQLALPAVTDAVALPVSALYGLTGIYRIHEQRLERLQVERLGNQYLGSGVLVRHPELQNGDLILSTQLTNAVSGLQVRILETAESSDLAARH